MGGTARSDYVCGYLRVKDHAFQARGSGLDRRLYDHSRKNAWHRAMGWLDATFFEPAFADTMDVHRLRERKRR